MFDSGFFACMSLRNIWFVEEIAGKQALSLMAQDWRDVYAFERAFGFAWSGTVWNPDSFTHLTDLRKNLKRSAAENFEVVVLGLLISTSSTYLYSAITALDCAAMYDSHNNETHDQL